MKKSTLFLFVILLASIVSAQTKNEDKTHKIGELMEQYHKKRGFHGTVLVAEHGQIIYEKAFGYASLEWEIPNTLDTRFALASVSKPFAATLAVLAAQTGELSLDDKISDYLSDYPKEKGDKITVRHLLLHTSGTPIGVPPQFDRPDLFQEKQCTRLTRSQYLKLISDQELLFEPGTQFQYSNWGYSLLAMVLEKALGKTYSQLLQERIFMPLDMKHSCTNYGTEIINKRATRYFYWFMREPELAPLLDQASTIGCSDIYSTVGDLYLYDRALNSDSFISNKYRKLMFTPRLANNGFGWIIEDQMIGFNKRKVKVVKREGGSEGTRTCMLRYIEDDHLIVILSNYREPYFLRTWLARPMQDIAPDIAAILYDEEYELPKKSAAHEMGLSFIRNGWEQTEIAFRKEIESNNKKYDFIPEEFLWAAFSLYNQHQTEEALHLFRFTEQFLPLDDYDESWRFFFNYGRAYMARKDWVNAISKLEIAIKLDPPEAAFVPLYINYCHEQINSTKKK